MTEPPSAPINPARVPYARMNGTGNAILVLDCRRGGHVGSAGVVRLAATPGFAFDQVMALHPPRSTGTDGFVEIFNSDGSLAGACGNGTRCVAWYLLRTSASDHCIVETRAGLLDCRRRGAARFTVDMGPPGLGWRDVPLAHPVDDILSVTLDPEIAGAEALGPATVLSMGNPHAVFFLDAAASPPVGTLGPGIERHPLFPDRANVSFARIVGPDHIRLDVWERGAGPTLACGSGACATAVAAILRGLTGRSVAIDLPGGTLEVDWREQDGHVLMTGDVELEREGEVALADPVAA